MSSRPLFAPHKLASFLIILALSVSFVIPAYAQDTAVADDVTAYVPDDAAAEATQDATADFETAQRSGCQGNLTIDQPSGTVTGTGLISGWLADLANPFNPGGPVDLYRGNTFIASTATGASRDVGNVRPDVDSAVGLSDGRTGWFFIMDWSKEPGGQQTYRVLGRTDCEWLEKTFTVNVNPAPPAPAAGLSINDVSRTLGSTGYTGIGAVGTTCITYNPSPPYNCTQYGSTGTGIGTGIGNCPAGYYWNGVSCIYNGSNINTVSDVNFEFTVTLSPATTQQVQVDYGTADGSGINGTDYTATSGTLTFAAGETTKTISVRVYNRVNIGSSTRDFIVRLSNPRNASISDGEGRGTIRNYSNTTTTGCVQYDINGNCTSYGGGIGIGIGNCPAGYYWNGVSCIYNGTGTTGFGGTFTIQNLNGSTCSEGSNCTFRITQSGGSGLVSVTWTATGASGGSSSCTGSFDYAPNTGTVTVNPNSFTDVPIVICADADIGAESFTVTIVPSSGSATINAVSVTIP